MLEEASVNSRATIYLVLTALGLLVPLVLFGVSVADNGLELGEVGDELYENPVLLAVAADLSLSSIVFWVWMSREAPKVGVRAWWPFVVANLILGLCFALPLFLYYRERRLGEAAAAA